MRKDLAQQLSCLLVLINYKLLENSKYQSLLKGCSTAICSVMSISDCLFLLIIIYGPLCVSYGLSFSPLLPMPVKRPHANKSEPEKEKRRSTSHSLLPQLQRPSVSGIPGLTYQEGKSQDSRARYIKKANSVEPPPPNVTDKSFPPLPDRTNQSCMSH